MAAAAEDGSRRDRYGLRGKLLIRKSKLAQLLDMPMRTLERLEATEAIPGRVTLGRNIRYDVEIVLAWKAAGFPPVNRWDGGEG